jgi:phosphate-selective porin OprO/OprP
MKKPSIIILLFCVSLPLAAQQRDTTDNQTLINQYGVKVNRNRLMAEERNGVLVFESLNRNYSFWMDSRLQFDGAVFFGKSPDLEPIGNGVAVRRARLAVNARVTKNWYGQLDLDFSKGIPEIKDAYIRYSGLGFLEFQMGNFKEMFSMEQNNTSRYLAFMERPMVVSALAPERHLGLQVQANCTWLLAAAGVFFQPLEDADMYDNVQKNNEDYGRGPGYSVTAKWVAMPFAEREDRGLHIALAGSYRTPTADVAPKNYGSMRYNSRNVSFINRKKYLDTKTIQDVHHSLLMNAELAGYFKGFRFQGEYIRNFVRLNSPVESTGGSMSRLAFGGWYIHAGILLFGGRQNYDAHTGEFSQPVRGRSWGDMELMLRYDCLNLNSGPVQGGEGGNVTAGLNYYVNNNIKFVLNYVYSRNKSITGGNEGISYHGMMLRTEIDF